MAKIKTTISVFTLNIKLRFILDLFINSKFPFQSQKALTVTYNVVQPSFKTLAGV